MADEKKSLYQVDVTDLGIKVALVKNPDIWIMYRLDGWTIDDEFQFQKTRRDFDAFRMIVDKSVDWNIQNGNGKIAFDRADVLKQLELADKGESFVTPKIPIALQKFLSDSFWSALAAARELPLV